MKKYEKKLNLITLLTFASATFSYARRTLVTDSADGWMGSSAILDIMMKRTIFNTLQKAYLGNVKH
jgi:hypothetical protein